MCAALRRPQGAFEIDRCMPDACAWHQDRWDGVACRKAHRRGQTRQLRRLVGMLVRWFAAVVLDVQCLVGVVVVVHFLCVHDHVPDDLGLVVKMGRGEPRQCLPDHGNQQDEGSAFGGHKRIVEVAQIAPDA
ncbi:hypothetical protein ASF44_24225 [Pseudorhodoferax sp. Leaf274]|nr:hypothetical protein ASF44_24225 [Pseudorhodoferax sp. Leaf274]